MLFLKNTFDTMFQIHPISSKENDSKDPNKSNNRYSNENDKINIEVKYLTVYACLIISGFSTNIFEKYESIKYALKSRSGSRTLIYG